MVNAPLQKHAARIWDWLNEEVRGKWSMDYSELIVAFEDPADAAIFGALFQCTGTKNSRGESITHGSWKGKGENRLWNSRED